MVTSGCGNMGDITCEVSNIFILGTVSGIETIRGMYVILVGLSGGFTLSLYLLAGWEIVINTALTILSLSILDKYPLSCVLIPRNM